MDTGTLLTSAEKLLAPWTAQAGRPEDNRLDVYIAPQDLKPAVQALLEAHWGYLAAINGLDMPAPAAEEGAEPQEGRVEMLYHFCEGAAVVTLRLALPYSQAVLDSICDLIPSATLYEREMIEMLGVQLTGTPSQEHLLLPDDWPADVYPLRKSFTGLSGKTEK
ncbi:MAG: NADH-quinone oxidoreductase subunit C [Chloroflexi bacterium]|jgi:Ni,Fe-hydrogenase III component G|nr:NADH-quinone oxidoreductase subunit C [Anaerolineaceae bacterium]NMB89218.1 NADH-quinone oxidoreductase subunit C [Chloroflexota bacterium]